MATKNGGKAAKSSKKVPAAKPATAATKGKKPAAEREPVEAGREGATGAGCGAACGSK